MNLRQLKQRIERLEREYHPERGRTSMYLAELECLIYLQKRYGSDEAIPPFLRGEL